MSAFSASGSLGSCGCCTKTVHHATCEKKRWQNFTILTPTYTFRFIVIARAMCYDKYVTTCWDSPPRNQMDLTSDNDTQGLRIACAGPDHVRNYTREGICFNSGLFRIPGRCRARSRAQAQRRRKLHTWHERSEALEGVSMTRKHNLSIWLRNRLLK